MDKIRVVNKLKEKRVDSLEKTITQKIQKIINKAVCNEKRL